VSSILIGRSSWLRASRGTFRIPFFSATKTPESRNYVTLARRRLFSGFEHSHGTTSDSSAERSGEFAKLSEEFIREMQALSPSSASQVGYREPG
jgi:hypothetical protein